MRSSPNPLAHTRLFCFPYAGAGALAFRPWAAALPDIEVCAIELPGRETRFREPPVTDLPTLIHQLVAALYPRYLDRPFAFFGHSLGALIAFELTRALTAHHAIAPSHLVVSARLAPHARDPRPPIHSLSDHDLIAMLRALAGTPEELLSDPAMAPILGIIRADFALNERYEYAAGDPLDVPLIVYGGTSDPKVTEDELRAWQDHARRAFTLRMFPGDHFFITAGRASVLRALAHDLAAF